MLISPSCFAICRCVVLYSQMWQLQIWFDNQGDVGHFSSRVFFCHFLLFLHSTSHFGFNYLIKARNSEMCQGANVTVCGYDLMIKATLARSSEVSPYRILANLIREFRVLGSDEVLNQLGRKPFVEPFIQRASAWPTRTETKSLNLGFCSRFVKSLFINC